MAKMITEFKVENFGKWKLAFDSMHLLRKQYGCTSEQIYQRQDNPNEIVTILLWETQEQAQKYIKSPELEAVKSKTGQGGPRNFYFVD